MSLYDALAEHRNKWIGIYISDGACLHGVLEEVKPTYVKLKIINTAMKWSTEYIPINTILRFFTDSEPLFVSQIEAAYYHVFDEELTAWN